MAVQTELHRHLDISLRLSTLLELARARGLVAPELTADTFRAQIVLEKPLASLREVIDRFSLFQDIYDRMEVCERVAFECAEDSYREGTRKLELRYSPAFVCTKTGLAWEDALAGFSAGLARARKKYPDLRTGLICIATREFGLPEVEHTIDFYLRHRGDYLGLDLAGDEASFPNATFRAPFRRARDAGARITIHAGEAGGPENVRSAIEELGAERIGHGITSVMDPKLMDELARRSICLEVCPTSNWLTRATPSLQNHPLPQLLRAGVPVSINTDDPSVFGVDLPHEIEVCRSLMGLTEGELKRCREAAEQASFL